MTRLGPFCLFVCLLFCQSTCFLYFTLGQCLNCKADKIQPANLNSVSTQTESQMHIDHWSISCLLLINNKQQECLLLVLSWLGWDFVYSVTPFLHLVYFFVFWPCLFPWPRRVGVRARGSGHTCGEVGAARKPPGLGLRAHAWRGSGQRGRRWGWGSGVHMERVGTAGFSSGGSGHPISPKYGTLPLRIGRGSF